jgi:hypothetical protein
MTLLGEVFPSMVWFPNSVTPTSCRDWSHGTDYSKVRTLEGPFQENQHGKGSWPQKPGALDYISSMLKSQDRKRNLGFLYFKMPIVSVIALVKSKEMNKQILLLESLYKWGIYKCWCSFKNDENQVLKSRCPLKMTWNNYIC